MTSLLHCCYVVADWWSRTLSVHVSVSLTRAVNYSEHSPTCVEIWETRNHVRYFSVRVIWDTDDGETMTLWGERIVFYIPLFLFYYYSGPNLRKKKFLAVMFSRFYLSLGRIQTFGHEGSIPEHHPFICKLICFNETSSINDLTSLVFTPLRSRYSRYVHVRPCRHLRFWDTTVYDSIIT